MSETNQSHPLEGGRILDLASGTVVDPAGPMVRLTNTEIRFLICLASQPGTPMSRATLIRSVWKKTINPKGVDVLVGRLRAKIEQKPKEPVHLVSVPGEGFQWNPSRAAPVAQAPLFGRDVELRWIKARLEAGERCLHLVGPPGVGKSALMERALHPAWPRIDAGGCQSIDQLTEALALALGSDVASPMEALATRLDGVLGVDNLEHLAQAESWVGDLLLLCPEVQVVSTSQNRFRQVHAAHLVVQPLALGTTTQMLAGLVGQDTSDEMETIAAQLGGLPLAIKLVAARWRLLGGANIRDRLADGWSSFLGQHRGQPVALDAVMAWATNALSDLEIRAGTRCAIFSSGFDLEDAEALGVSFAQLACLQDRSLLMTDHSRPLPHHMLAPLRRHFLEGQVDTEQWQIEWAQKRIDAQRQALRTNRAGPAQQAWSLAHRHLLASAARAAHQGGQPLVALDIAALAFGSEFHASDPPVIVDLQRQLAQDESLSTDQRILATNAVWAMDWTQGVTQATQNAKAAVALLQPTTPDWEAATALGHLAWCQNAAADWNALRETLARWAPSAQRLGGSTLRLYQLIDCELLGEDGDFDGLRAQANLLIKEAEATEAIELTWRLLVGSYAQQGDFEKACPIAVDCMGQIIGQTQPGDHRRLNFCSVLASMLVELGRVSEAWEWMTSLEPVSGTSTPSESQSFWAHKAMVAVLMEEHHGANTLLNEHQAVEQGTSLRTLAAWMCVAAALGEASLAKELEQLAMAHPETNPLQRAAWALAMGCAARAFGGDQQWVGQAEQAAQFRGRHWFVVGLPRVLFEKNNA